MSDKDNVNDPFNIPQGDEIPGITPGDSALAEPKSDAPPTPKKPIMYEIVKEDKTTEANVDRALRPSEGEPVFRRYEPFIALASRGSYTIDPREQKLDRTKRKGVNKHTFCIYFRDALNAYFNVGYHSITILNTLKVTDISLSELSNGCVKVSNRRRMRCFSPAEVPRVLSTLSSEGEFTPTGIILYDRAFFDSYENSVSPVPPSLPSL